MAELKNKVIHGFAWNVGERVVSALFQVWVVVNVTNRIYPDDYALKAILAAFVMIFNTFVDSGFSQALIRNRAATRTDYSSAFWFNIVVSLVVYGLLVCLAYPTARILQMPGLVRFAPVFFLVVPLSALGIIQQTVLTREMNFRRLSAITFVSGVVAGLLAVGLAFAGFGFWAIVGQRVAQSAVRSGLLWIFGRWRVSWRFSRTSIGRMLGYSSRLLATDFLNNLYTSIPNFIIGRIHSGTLGNFEQARSIRDLPLTSTMNSMQSVTFPALARLSGDEEKFTSGVSRVVGSIVFLMFPMMAGLIVVSGELFGVFLAPQWQASVPFFRILCLAGFATPLGIVSSNILRTRTDGRAVLRAEVVRKVIATVIFGATIPFGVAPITWGVVAIAFSDAAVSFFFARGQFAYGFRPLARDTLPTLALTVVMALVVWISGWWLSGMSYFAEVSKVSLAVLLGVKILVGAGVYLVGAAVLRFAAFREFRGLVLSILRAMRVNR